MLYRALLSFTTKNYDVRKNQVLDSDFTTADEIQELLTAGYIQVDDGSIKITVNGQYDVEDFEIAKVDVEGSSAEVNALIDEINGEVI